MNPQPTDYKSVALPVELQRHNGIVPLWWLGTESNRRHKDFQSFALPTELPSLGMCEKNMAESTGFEPAFSCVTGRHVRPLHHDSAIKVLLPLIMSLCKVSFALRGLWCRQRDSNPRPAVYDTAALPAELRRHSGGG